MTTLQKDRELVDELKSKLFNQLRLDEVTNVVQTLIDFKNVVEVDNSLQKQKDLKESIDNCNHYAKIGKQKLD